MVTVSFFKDTLSLDNNIAALLASATPPLTIHAGDTLVLGGHQCSISALPGDYNYFIAADKLSLIGASSLIVRGTTGNPSPNVTVLAIEIDGAFDLWSDAMPGAPGRNGENGEDGVRVAAGWNPPATPGEDGQPGGAGSPGGKAVVHYCNAPQQPPTARASGGIGGAGGHGGAGGTGGGTGGTIPGHAANGIDKGPGKNGAAGQSEVTELDPSQIWNALDSESLVEWAEFRGASITTWSRLEPRCRAQDLRAGLEARLFDPLWLLARQWQIGEFAGRDAGSPVAVDVTTTTHSIDRYAAGTGTGQTYDTSMPLEVLAERETVRPVSAATDLRQAAEAGLHFVRLLDAAGLSHLRAAYLAQYPLPGLTGAPSGFSALIAGRVMDGVALHADLIAATNNLPLKPVISAADRGLLLPVAQAWLAWYQSLISESSQGDTWAPDRMEYSFAIGATGETGSFAAREYDGGTIDWHTFDKTAVALAGGSAQPPSTTRRAIASPVSFRGMPARRYWELEDGSVDIGAMAAGPEDLGRLLLREFALVYGTDWFLIPLKVPVGSVTNIDSFKVSDTFGLITTVPHYSAADGAGGPWRLFAISADESSTGASPDNRLLILPSGMGILDSEPVEDVLMLRDELANMVWGVERTALGAEGVPVDRALAWKIMAPPIPPPATPGSLRYLLGSEVPDYWIPLLPVLVSTGPPQNAVSLRFRRGTLPTGPGAQPLGVLLNVPGLTIFPEEVPREGVHLERLYRLVRDAAGLQYLWMGRSRSTGQGEGNSGLRFDFLES